jgi:hypothetical protein
MTLNQGHPIYEAIDKGGGQTCDITGVLRELDAAGFIIVPKEPTEQMVDYGLECLCEENRMNGLEDVKSMWRLMLDVFYDRHG